MHIDTGERPPSQVTDDYWVKLDELAAVLARGKTRRPRVVCGGGAPSGCAAPVLAPVPGMSRPPLLEWHRMRECDIPGGAVLVGALVRTLLPGAKKRPG